MVSQSEEKENLLSYTDPNRGVMGKLSKLLTGRKKKGEGKRKNS